MTVDLVAATRPNSIRTASVRCACVAPRREAHPHRSAPRCWHERRLLPDLGMPRANVNPGGGGASHAEQAASVLVAMETELLAHQPEAIVVVGNVTSTLSAGLAGAKLGVPVVRVEAGLRSHEWTTPEKLQPHPHPRGLKQTPSPLKSDRGDNAGGLRGTSGLSDRPTATLATACSGGRFHAF